MHRHLMSFPSRKSLSSHQMLGQSSLWCIIESRNRSSNSQHCSLHRRVTVSNRFQCRYSPRSESRLAHPRCKYQGQCSMCWLKVVGSNCRYLGGATAGPDRFLCKLAQDLLLRPRVLQQLRGGFDSFACLIFFSL